LRRILAILALVAAAGACRDRPRESPGPTLPPIGFIDESAVGAPRDGGTLYRRLEGEPATLNPILQTSDYEDFVISLVSRNLVDFDKRLEVTGGLCDHWEFSPDHASITLHIREDAVWEDGAPVTAHDAAFTIRKAADPATGAVLFSTGFDGLRSVQELGAKTLRVSFSEPYAYRLYAFNMPVLRADRYQKGETSGVQAGPRLPVSDGPYRVVGWKTSESITLERNTRYWGEPGHFDRIVFRILPDGTQAYRALARGLIDEMRMTTAQYRASRTDPDFRKCCRATVFYDLSYVYVGFNNRSPLFADVRTRRALSMLLDRGAIVRDLYFGTARILSGPWPADLPAYDPFVAPYPFDPAHARALLAEAGWRNAGGVLERGGLRFEFDLLYGSGSVAARQVSEIYESALQAVGILCHPRPVEWAAFEKRMDSGDFQAVFSAWSGDPNPDLYAFWHSSQAPPNGLNNLSYSDPKADRLMEEVRLEFDPAKRLRLLHELHRVIHDDAPAIFALQGAQKYAVSRRIGGLVTTPMGLFKFWPDSSAWWDRGETPRP
jgi:peptide/nickel transport system substrate-binding protein